MTPENLVIRRIYYDRGWHPATIERRYNIPAIAEQAVAYNDYLGMYMWCVCEQHFWKIVGRNGAHDNNM